MAVLGPLLLATERSEEDQGAERLAFALVQALNARAPGGNAAASLPLPVLPVSPALPVLPVVMPLVSNPEYEAVAPQLAERAGADAARRREALQAVASAAGVALVVQVRRGSEPYREIVAAAAEQHAAFIVIRRRGQRGRLANLLIGEMVSKVLAHAPCSVVVVPREASLWQRGVLVAVDPHEPSAALVAQAAGVAAATGQPLHLVCVAARESERGLAEEALGHACAALEAAPNSALASAPGSAPNISPASAEVRVGAAHAQIIEAAAACGADLIVLARHGGSALGRAWIGGVAQKVIGLARCAVLVQVPPPKDTAPQA